MTAFLSAIGTAQPPHLIEQESAAVIARGLIYGEGPPERSLETLFRRTRVQRRGSVLLESGNGSGLRLSFFPPPFGPDDRGPRIELRMQRYAQEAPGLALLAAERALAAAEVAAGEITHLVTVSCTGFTAPGVEFDLIKGLELPPTVGRVNVGFMGCHGTLNALRVAKAFAEADAAVRLLLCSVELCSLHYHYGEDAQQLVANALFADGAAGMVISGEASRERPGWKIAGCGSCLLPDAETAMTWRIKDHGFQMTLSPEVPDLIAESLRPWLVGWLASHDLRIDEIGSWAIHPGGPKIVACVAEALGLPPTATEASLEVLAECGNMSSATVPFVLERLGQRSAPSPCVALAFGPGLVAEAALFV